MIELLIFYFGSMFNQRQNLKTVFWSAASPASAASFVLTFCFCVFKQIYTFIHILFVTKMIQCKHWGEIEPLEDQDKKEIDSKVLEETLTKLSIGGPMKLHQPYSSEDGSLIE